MQPVDRQRAFLIAASFWFAAGAAAQAYPTKPIRIVVGTAHGGAVDTLARFIGNKLTEGWGQQVVIDNRAGASGAIGAELVTRAAPDGYTLLMVSTQFAINPLLSAEARYDPVKNFAPVILVTQSPNILVVHPSLPAASVSELIVLAKSKPRALTYASGGVGTSNHLAAELFKAMAKVDILHVPFKSAAPALTDVIAGQVNMIFPNLISGLPHVKAGRLKALAVTSGKRALAAPELPTIAESGVPGYETSPWLGLVAPLQTPRPIVLKLNGQITAIFNEPAVRERLMAEGAEFVGGNPERFGVFMKSETDKWIKVLKGIGLNSNTTG